MSSESEGPLRTEMKTKNQMPNKKNSTAITKSKSPGMARRESPMRSQPTLNHDANEQLRLRIQVAEKLLFEVPNFIGLQDSDVAQHIFNQTFHAVSVASKKDSSDDPEELGKVALAVRLLQEMKPSNAIEAMLCNQMIAVNDAAMATIAPKHTQPGKCTWDVESVRFSSRLMKLFLEQVEAYQKLKGLGGQQKVTVEHVHVHEGGQAIVGSVEGLNGKGGAGDE